MSSSTATAARWFVPDSEWAALNADYAVVHESALSVRRTVQEYNEALPSRSYSSYRDFLDEIKYQPSPYHIITEGTLVFADVDQHNPSHKEQVLAWAKEPQLETKTAETIAAETALLSVLGGKTDAEHLVKLVKIEAADGLREVFVNYILNADDKTHRQECLRVLSGQAKTKSPRKVLMLVTMFDSTLPSSAQPATPTGWLCAYDLLDHALLIKPFLSKPSHHPLGDSWTLPPPPDGISFHGTPASFLETYSPAPEPKSPPPAASEPEPPTAGFRLVMFVRVGKWLLRHWAALRAADPALADMHKFALLDALHRAKALLADRPFPTPPLAGDEVAAAEGAQRRPMWGWECLLGHLEEGEEGFRREAVWARETGGEEGVVVGERAAGLWEEVVGLVGGFVGDERNWVSGWEGEEEEDGEWEWEGDGGRGRGFEW